MALTFQTASDQDRASAQALADATGTEQGDLTRAATFVAVGLDSDGAVGAYCGYEIDRFVDIGGVYIASLGVDPSLRGDAVMVAMCKWLVRNVSPNGVFSGIIHPGSPAMIIIRGNFNPVETVLDSGDSFFWSSAERLGW